MIQFLVTPAHGYTIATFLELAPELSRLVRAVPYGDPRKLEVAPGTKRVIFSDIERLAPEYSEMLAKKLGPALVDSSGARRFLNHPTRSMRRFELLRTLHQHGTNPFNAYRWTELEMPKRYPVFLRDENEHRGPLSELLRDETSLRQVLRAAFDKNLSREGKLIVEFEDIRDADGLYHKYSAFRVGSQIIPRHRFVSKRWCIKDPDQTGEPHASREQEYIDKNPHATELMEIFNLARIDYGRIDYAVQNGKIRVWEINTNPMLFRQEHFADPSRSAVHEQCRKALVQAFEALVS